MMLQHELRGDILIVRPIGRLDSASSPELERQLVEYFETGARRLVFDLADLDYVSSAGMRAILLAAKTLRGSRGRLALAGLRDMVRDVFEMSGFLSVFSVLPTVDEAMANV